ncbi:hypothetical protein NKG94_50625 [Micromonospora sp. M12]
MITAADTRAIQATASGLDTSTVERVAAAIATAGRVEIFGLGSSGTAGSEMAFRLERIRIPVRYRADTHTALTNAALLGPGTSRSACRTPVGPGRRSRCSPRPPITVP